MPKRKIKEEKPPKRLGRKELLIAPIAMGGATLLALVIIPAFAPPPDPSGVCLKAHNIEQFQLFPRIEVIVDGQLMLLPDNVGKQPKEGEECLRPIHTDNVGNLVHIEYIRVIRFTMADFMRVYSQNNTITVIDNSTGVNQAQILNLTNFDVRYSYFSMESQDCDGTYVDKDCYKQVIKPSDTPPFPQDNKMLARVELTKK